jgi:hypothetical protein
MNNERFRFLVIHINCLFVVFMCWKFLTIVESLLNGEATFTWSLNPCLWCTWLILKCCGTLLFMEKEIDALPSHGVKPT